MARHTQGFQLAVDLHLIHIEDFEYYEKQGWRAVPGARAGNMMYVFRRPPKGAKPKDGRR